MIDPDFAALVATGLLLGWSVAWPPGPINAEIARRTIARGFLPGAAVGYGAAVGDAAWALAVSFGAGALARDPVLGQILGAVSLALLLGLAFMFLRAAWRRMRAWRTGERATAPASRFDDSKTGVLLGAFAALASPFNVAFWLAVIGRPDVAAKGAEAGLALAAGVLGGTVFWVTLFAGAIAAFRARLDHPAWDIFTHAATGLLMLYFAARSLGWA